MSTHKINNFNQISVIFFTLFIFMLFSCNLTKNLSDNEQLLVKNEVKITNKDFNKSNAGFKEKDIEQILKPQTNTKILFSVPLKLIIYNLSKPEKVKRKINRKLERCEKHKAKKRSAINKKIKSYEKTTDILLSETKKYKRLVKKISRLREKADNLNLNNCEKNHWTQKFGESPVLYRLNDQYRNIRKIKIFLKEKGYYNTEISVIKTAKKFNDKKITVKYELSIDRVHRIKNVFYNIEDKNIKNIILSDTAHSILKKGSRFDVSKIEDEQERLSKLIRNSGYYNFTKDFISFTADTINKNKQDDIYVVIKKDTLNEMFLKAFKRYIIKNIYIYPNFKPREALTDKKAYFSSHDTLIYYAKNDKKYYFLYNQMPRINPKAVIKGIYLTPGQYFNLNDINATYRYLASLAIIQVANIKFTEDKNINSDSVAYLNCEIRLTQAKLQSRKITAEFSNTSGNFGVGGNLSYTHNNFFRNTEMLNLGAKLAFKRLTKNKSFIEDDTTGFFNSREYGINFSLNFPRLIAPVPMKKFIKRRNPKTVISGSYDFLERPDYSYTVAGGNIAYYWNSTKTTGHGFFPLITDVVELKNPSNDFLELIKRLQLEETYETHFIFGSSYRFTYNNQFFEKKRNTIFLSVNTKIAGNSLSAYMNWRNKPKTDGSYRINNIVFAQFFKEEIEVRYHMNFLRENDKIAFRFFSGAAYPYGNLKVVPFGERYFVGGANSIRAWQSRSLGPGSYIKNDSLESYPNQTADIRLEANIEYRMKLFGKTEGALFIDAGNIWAINSQDARPGALFRFDTFYKEIAVGAGAGLRLDLGFVLLRLDSGIKLRDPALTSENKWIPANRKFIYDDWTLFFAIGYPF